VSDAPLNIHRTWETTFAIYYVNFLLEFYQHTDLVVRLGERWQDQEQLTRLGSDRERFGMRSRYVRKGIIGCFLQNMTESYRWDALDRSRPQIFDRTSVSRFPLKAGFHRIFSRSCGWFIFCFFRGRESSFLWGRNLGRAAQPQPFFAHGHAAPLLHLGAWHGTCRPLRLARTVCESQMATLHGPNSQTQLIVLYFHFLKNTLSDPYKNVR
jgi:hypothetical protein